VPQEININAFESPETIVVNQAGFYGIPRRLARERAEKYLTQLSLWDKRTAMARTLSGGMKRRLMIARALMHEPRLLILDEPTAGVDIEIRRQMWDFLRDLNASGTTIILTTHYLEEAESLCRNIAIIDRGRIAERDRMANLLRKLHTESFVLNTRNVVTAAPALPGYDLERIDDHTIEVELAREQSLNDVFAGLSAGGIEVVSMRNKVNRLEEIFMRLVDKSAAGADVAAAGGGGAAGAGGGHPQGHGRPARGHP
jgi:ABC-2 type transport system ATP-binding protein